MEEPGLSECAELRAEHRHHSRAAGGSLSLRLPCNAGRAVCRGLCPVLHLPPAALCSTQLLWDLLPHDPGSLRGHGEYV